MRYKGRRFRRRSYRPRRRFVRRTYRARHIRRHETRWYQISQHRLAIPQSGYSTCGTQVMSLDMNQSAVNDSKNWGYYKIVRTVHRYKFVGQLGERHKLSERLALIDPTTGATAYSAFGNGPDGIHLTYLLDRDGWSEETTYSQMLSDPRARTVLLKPNRQVTISSRNPSMSTPVYMGATAAAAGQYAWKQNKGYMSTDYPGAYWYGMVVGLHNASENTLADGHITREIWIKVVFSVAKNQYFMRKPIEYMGLRLYDGDLTGSAAATTNPFPGDDIRPEATEDRPPASIPPPVPPP